MFKWLLVNVSTQSLILVRPPTLDDTELQALADAGGYSNLVSMSEYTSVLCLSVMAVVSQRFMWETQTQPLTDSQWQTILDKIQLAERELMNNLSIGSFFWSVQLIIDPNLLIPIGQLIPQSDYTELTAVVPVSWLVGSDIQLPNLIETGFIAAMDIPSIGQTRGSNTHTLTESELAVHTHIQDPHSHSYNDNLDTPIVAAPGAIPASFVTPLPSVTGANVATNQNAGGGQPHNNVQQSLQLVPYLIAR